jgi:hypothetical protein
VQIKKYSKSFQGGKLVKAIGMFMIVVGAAGFAMASVTPVPEIDSASAASAVALLSGALLVMRGRLRKK